MTNTTRTRMESDGSPACECGDATVVCERVYDEHEHHHHDACASSWGLDGYPVGMVYAPIQRFDHILDLDTAMHRGTIFEELDLPFLCGNHTKGGCCNG